MSHFSTGPAEHVSFGSFDPPAEFAQINELLNNIDTALVSAAQEDNMARADVGGIQLTCTLLGLT